MFAVEARHAGHRLDHDLWQVGYVDATQPTVQTDEIQARVRGYVPREPIERRRIDHDRMGLFRETPLQDSNMLGGVDDEPAHPGDRQRRGLGPLLRPHNARPRVKPAIPARSTRSSSSARVTSTVTPCRLIQPVTASNRSTSAGKLTVDPLNTLRCNAQRRSAIVPSSRSSTVRRIAAGTGEAAAPPSA